MSDSDLEKAQLEKLKGEIALLTAERAKVLCEERDIESRLSQKWWHLPLSSIIKVIVAGLALGGVVLGFGLETFKHIYEANKEEVLRLKDDTATLKGDKKKLEDKAKELSKQAGELDQIAEAQRQELTRVNRENEAANIERMSLKKQLDAATGALGECRDEELRKNLEEARKQLAAITAAADKRAQRLKEDRAALAEASEIPAASGKPNWFAVIASPYDEKELFETIQGFRSRGLDYPLNLYRTSDRKGTAVYALTLGGNLSRAEADKRVTYAKSKDLARDAYAWSSNLWGKNLMSRVLVTVPGYEPWTSTGIELKKDWYLWLSASGEVLFTDSEDPQKQKRRTAGPNGVPQDAWKDGKKWSHPLDGNVGALIWKVSEDGAPKFFSEHPELPAPEDGELFLGINDKRLTDNDGSFDVKVTVLRVPVGNQ